MKGGFFACLLFGADQHKLLVQVVPSSPEPVKEWEEEVTSVLLTEVRRDLSFSVSPLFFFSFLQPARNRIQHSARHVAQEPQSIRTQQVQCTYPAKNTALFLLEYTVFCKTKWSRYLLSSPSIHEYVPFSVEFHFATILSYTRSCKPQTELKSSATKVTNVVIREK